MNVNYTVNSFDIILDIQTEFNEFFDGTTIPFSDKIYIKFNNGQIFKINVEEI